MPALGNAERYMHTVAPPPAPAHSPGVGAGDPDAPIVPTPEPSSTHITSARMGRRSYVPAVRISVMRAKN